MALLYCISVGPIGAIYIPYTQPSIPTGPCKILITRSLDLWILFTDYLIGHGRCVLLICGGFCRPNQIVNRRPNWAPTCCQPLGYEDETIPSTLSSYESNHFHGACSDNNPEATRPSSLTERQRPAHCSKPGWEKVDRELGMPERFKLPQLGTVEARNPTTPATPNYQLMPQPSPRSLRYLDRARLRDTARP